MFKRIGLKLVGLGLWLVRRGMRMQRAEAVCTLHHTDYNGTKCVAVTYGDQVNQGYLLAAASIRPLTNADTQPKIQYVVTLVNSSEDVVVGVYNTEPEARDVIRELRNDPDAGKDEWNAAYDLMPYDLSEPVGYGVTRTHNGVAEAYVFVAGEEEAFDANAPLWPVHDSAD